MGLYRFVHIVAFAAEKHRWQRRKDINASPYINHPLQVASVINSVDFDDQYGNKLDTNSILEIQSNVLCAAVLHDVLEDTQTTFDELERRTNTEIASLVLEVTDDPDLPRAERKAKQIANAPKLSDGAKLIKLADKICNVRDTVEFPPVGWSIEKKREYCLFAGQVVDGLRGVNSTLEYTFDRAMKDADRLYGLK